MLTALVVGSDPTDRAGTARLLAAAGWSVRGTAGLREALSIARSVRPDLVVVDLDLPGGDGPALLRRLRMTGCRAHLVGTAHVVTPELREAATAAGALAVVPAPVDPGVLLRFLLGRLTDGPLPEHQPASEEQVDPELAVRLQDLYADALPARLLAIDEGARTGDAPALASASATLAGVSAQLGHPEVAELCHAIAAEARRGVLAHQLVGRLVEVVSA